MASFWRKSEIPSHLQKYFCPAEIGLEPDPETYISRLVDVFREVRRVLHRSGTLWVVMGDSYASSSTYNTTNTLHTMNGWKQEGAHRPNVRSGSGLKPKDLIGIPWALAFALRADGWYLRSDIIWAKRAPMPESMTDRPTKAHEYVFLLSKSQTYFYDAAAVAEPSSGDSGWARQRQQGIDTWQYNEAPERLATIVTKGGDESRGFGRPGTRNKRSVWHLGPESYDGAHFAVFPTALVEPCILAGTSEYGCCPACLAPYERVVERTPMVIARTCRREQMGDFGRTQSSGTMLEPASSRTTGWAATCRCNAGTPMPCTVLDCFAGSGTVGQVAVKHRRNALLIELNPAYCTLIDKRLNGVQQTLPLDGEAS